MEAITVIVQVVIFIVLLFGYYKLCSKREASAWVKVVEVISLYTVSILSVLGNIKFMIWALCIAAIGVIKLLITKQQKIERGNKGLVN